MSIERIKNLAKEIVEDYNTDPAYRRGVAIGFLAGAVVVTIIVAVF